MAYIFSVLIVYLLQQEMGKILKSTGEDKFAKSKYFLAMKLFLDLGTNTSQFEDFMSPTMYLAIFSFFVPEMAVDKIRYDYILDTRSSSKLGIRLQTSPTKEEEATLNRIRKYASSL